MSDRHFLIDWPRLEAQVPLCRQHVGRLEKQDKFPKRVQVSPGRVAWWQDEIDAFLASRTRGAPPQREQLGPKAAVPEPDPQDIDLLRQIAAKHGLDLVPRKPERRRSGSPP